MAEPGPTSRAVRRPAASGTISNRQWQDIRQAARLTRSEGLKSITLHGVCVSGFPRDLQQQQRSPQQPQQQKKESHTVPDDGAAQSMETDDRATPVKSTKMLQRDAQRLKEFRGRQIAKRWGHLAFKFHYTVVWRNWLSTRHDARRKLGAGLWREWTRPQFDGGCTLAGRLSHRDVYRPPMPRPNHPPAPSRRATMRSRRSSRRLLPPRPRARPPSPAVVSSVVSSAVAVSRAAGTTCNRRNPLAMSKTLAALGSPAQTALLLEKRAARKPGSLVRPLAVLAQTNGAAASVEGPTSRCSVIPAYRPHGPPAATSVVSLEPSAASVHVSGNLCAAGHVLRTSSLTLMRHLRVSVLGTCS